MYLKSSDLKARTGNMASSSGVGSSTTKKIMTEIIANGRCSLLKKTTVRSDLTSRVSYIDVLVTLKVTQ